MKKKDGTEPDFDNKYWNFTKEGIYVDIVSEEALFSSTDKYKSSTGCQALYEHLNGVENVVSGYTEGTAL